ASAMLSQRIMMIRRSISTAEPSMVWVLVGGVRLARVSLIAPLIAVSPPAPVPSWSCSACLQDRPIRPRSTRPGHGGEIQEHLGAVDQVGEELLGHARPALAGDRLLQRLELLFHQVLDGGPGPLQALLALAGGDQVDGVEPSLGGLAL